MQGDRGESRERDDNENNIESELKGIKTGNKTIHKTFYILFVKNRAECGSNGDTSELARKLKKTAATVSFKLRSLHMYLYTWELHSIFYCTCSSTG